MFRVCREEGIRRLFAGASTATARAVLMTIGQLSFYDQIKITLLQTGYFQDNLATHFTASLSAVSFTPYLNLKACIEVRFIIGRYRDYYDTTARCVENARYECETW